MAGSTDCILEAMKMKNLHSRLSEYSSHDTCLITMTIPPNHLTSVDLPKKHRRGGQSALRFDRQREEKRHNFLRKVTDSAKTHFLQNNLPNCAGLILAGTANLKNELKNLLDPRLQKIVLKVVDTSYGGEAGFKEAVRASADLLSATRFGREKKVLENFFQKLARESEGVCYGIENVATALENGALDTLIIHEAFDTICEKNGTSSDKNFQWFADRHALFKTKIEIITGMSGECVQFVNGFCGIGGLTRYNWDHDYSDSAEDGSD